MDKKQFAERVASLRIKKGVSAREMSQTLELSDGYINNIENCVNYPSMKVFFLICDYFEITPQQFFDDQDQNPELVRKALDGMRRLDEDDMLMLLGIINRLLKNK